MNRACASFCLLLFTAAVGCGSGGHGGSSSTGGIIQEILSRVGYEALAQAAFLTPSSNTTPWMTSARNFAPFSDLHRF